MTRPTYTEPSTLVGLPARLSNQADEDITWGGDLHVLEIDCRGDAGPWNPHGTIAEVQLRFDAGHVASAQLNTSEAMALARELLRVVGVAYEYERWGE